MLKNSGEITVYRLYAKCVKNSLSRRVCQEGNKQQWDSFVEKCVFAHT